MAKRKLILIGGGDLAREVLWVAHAISAEADWSPAGVLDDNVEEARKRLSTSGCAAPVLGAIRDHQPKSDEVFVAAIGSPAHSLRNAEMLASRGAQFANVIHPSALIAPDAKIGGGCFLFANVVVSVGARLDDFVVMNLGSVAGHDAVLGRGSILSPGAMVMGRVTLGRGVFMGTGAYIVPGKKAGDLSTIGAGSTALSDVPAGVTVIGSPARPISPPRPNPQ